MSSTKEETAVTPAKRAPSEAPSDPSPFKKQKRDARKKTEGTMPIYLGKFKNRFLRKHSSLLHNCKGDDRPKGLIVTCSVGGETRALGQIRTFLDAWLPRLFPEHKSIWTTRPSALDIDLAIVGGGEEQQAADASALETTPVVDGKEDKEAGETKEEAGPTGLVDRRFQAVDAACSGLLFIRFRVDVCPAAFVLALFEHLEALSAEERAAARNTISHCNRLLPITHTMPSTLPDITSHCQAALPNLLPPPPASLAAVIEVRNNTTFRTAAVRDTILRCVPHIESYKIDLTAPDVVLFASVFKSVCGLGVLPHYYRFRKYNVQKVGDAPRPSSQITAEIGQL